MSATKSGDLDGDVSELLPFVAEEYSPRKNVPVSEGVTGGDVVDQMSEPSKQRGKRVEVEETDLR